MLGVDMSWTGTSQQIEANSGEYHKKEIIDINIIFIEKAPHNGLNCNASYF